MSIDTTQSYIEMNPTVMKAAVELNLLFEVIEKYK
jgi:hypothetical protein